MMATGITGGVGMGKTTVGNLLGELGFLVIDTDQLARELVVPGQPALEVIRTAFGEEIISPSGELDRHKLGSIVFADSEARLRLERILHPLIRQRWRDQLDIWRRQNVSNAIVLVPLLFEANLAADFDRILCVCCSRETQEQRLLNRGWKKEEIARRIAAQWPVEKKMNLADYVIWTEGDLEVTAEQVRRIFH